MNDVVNILEEFSAKADGINTDEYIQKNLDKCIELVRSINERPDMPDSYIMLRLADIFGESMRTADIEFMALLLQMFDTQKKKGADYGGVTGSDNFLVAEIFGVSSHKGILVRISDKISRLLVFLKNEMYRVKDESFEDTLIDNAVYSLKCVMEYRKRRTLTSEIKGMVLKLADNLKKLSKMV